MIGKKLYKGDTIGLISPSSPEKPEVIKNAESFLRQLGFNIKEGKHIYDKWGYLAGSDKDRAKDFEDMFLDEDVDMILCVRGGYGSMRALPYIDFDIARDNPKIFVGFSDITPLLNIMAQRYGLITFHGPMGSSNLRDEATLKSFMNVLTNGFKPLAIKNPDGIESQALIPGSAEGILAGGNLGLICDTLGTEYELDTEGKILFIEEVQEEPYRIDRMLTQLLLAGKLQSCRGFILGQFTKCSLPHYERSLTLDEIIEDRILTLNKPTLSNFMSGHSYPRLTLPIGAHIRLNCEEGTITTLEPVVSL